MNINTYRSIIRGIDRDIANQIKNADRVRFFTADGLALDAKLTDINLLDSRIANTQLARVQSMIDHVVKHPRGRSSTILPGEDRTILVVTSK